MKVTELQITNYKSHQHQQMNSCTLYIFLYYYFAATCFDAIAIFR